MPPRKGLTCKEDREFIHPGEKSSIRSEPTWGNDFCKWKITTTPGHVIRFKFEEMSVDCRENVNGFFFFRDASKLEGGYHKAPICGSDRQYFEIYSDEHQIDLVFKSKSQEPTVFEISFESVEARLAHGQLHVSEIDSAANLYKLRQNMERPLPPVRLNSIARPPFDQSPVLLARTPAAPSSSNSPALLSQPWLLLVSATLAVLLMGCMSCVVFYWRKQKKRERTTSESPVLASSQPVSQVSKNHKRRPAPLHSGINDQKVHRFKS